MATVSTATSDTHDAVVRKSIEFEPSIWGDYFITHSHTDLLPKEYSEDWMNERVKNLVEEVKLMLRDDVSPLAKMHIIDALQRLGIDYHFETEIDQQLHQIYMNPCESDDPHTIFLQFRLLRQNRYNVSSDVFRKFKDEQGNFMASLASDPKGLLSMYDAAYLSTPQDGHILDEAIEFARNHLKSMAHDLDPILARQALHALETPLRRRMTRLEARLYMSIYEEDEENHNDTILELAKLDFHLLQLIHREEIKTICLWWKELGLSEKLPFCRDRVVETYFWILGIYFEPHYSRARMMMTKSVIFLSLTDDCFDNYGTVAELQQYNEVVQRWDLEAAQQLPEYLKLYFLALTDTLKVIEDELADDGTSYRVHFLKEMFKEVIGYWLAEAKLKDEGRLLPLEEYIHLSLKTTAYHVLACASFVGMEKEATKDVFEWVIKFPKIVEASNSICRFMDDVVDDELKTKGKNIVTTVGCYANEHGTSIDVAREKIQSMVEDAWKVINQEVINLQTIPMPIVMRVLNLGRMMETMYTNIDGYTHPTALKDYITLLLIEPVRF